MKASDFNYAEGIPNCGISMGYNYRAGVNGSVL